MSELSAEEKRRILRERRQAKLAQGNASDRLNQILTNGSALAQKEGALPKGTDEVTETAPETVSKTAPETAKTAPETAKTASMTVPETAPETVSRTVSETKVPATATGVDLPSASSRATSPETHADPEDMDISALLQNPQAAEPEELDMDSLLSQIFSNGQSAGLPDTGDFFANMMKAMADENGTPADASHLTQVASYQQYQRKQLEARFILVRYVFHVANFVYHFRNQALFRSSAYAYTRNKAPLSSSFTMFFVSAEIAFISAYYYLLSSKGLLEGASSNNPIAKLLSMASAVFPQANAYRPLVNNLLVYWGGASIILSDLLLMVVLFGLVSIYS